jgi:plasmid stabilization system protein ParE
MARPARFDVVLLPPALRDADEIHAYIAESNPLNADRFVMDLKASIHSLERFPKRCRITRESRIAGFEVRAAIFGEYRILFTIIGGSVAVMRIVHGARKSGVRRS